MAADRSGREGIHVQDGRPEISRRLRCLRLREEDRRHNMAGDELRGRETRERRYDETVGRWENAGGHEQNYGGQTARVVGLMAPCREWRRVCGDVEGRSDGDAAFHARSLAN